MPQLVTNQLTILFEAGDYPSLGLHLHTHIMTGLWYFYYTIDLLSTFNLLHHEIPLQHVLAIEDEQRMLQHLIALVTQLVPSTFFEQFHPPGFLVPPPARRQQVTPVDELRGEFAEPPHTSRGHQGECVRNDKGGRRQ